MSINGSIIGPPPSGSSGSGGAPSGAAGGELAGTYPNPTVKDAVIDDANIVAGGLTNAAIAAAAAIAQSKISGLTTALTAKAPTASPTFTGTVDASGATVTLPSGLVLPASVVLPATAVATTKSAGDNSTAPATTAYVDAADALKANLASPAFTGTPSLPTGATGVTQAASDSSTKFATTAYAKSQLAIGPDQIAANVSLYTRTTGLYGGYFVGITALKPIFYPINLGALPAMTIANLRLRVSTLLSSSTIGVAIYSVTYPSAAHVSATLVAQLNAVVSGTATGVFTPALTTGAAGSGAAPLAADFTTTRYLIGYMASDTGTLKCAGFTMASTDVSLGMISWTGAARSSTTDWPSSFSEAANIAAVSAATPGPAIDLLTATGAFYL